MATRSATRHRAQVAAIVVGVLALTVAAPVTWLAETAHPARKAPARGTGTTVPPRATSEPARGSLAAGASSSSAADWTVYDGNPLGTGVVATGPTFADATSAWTSRALDGQVYGEPLAWHGIVYAATEDDTVYALLARTGSVLWSTHLATPVPAGDLPCGDITPTVGVTGTPVLDPARHELFVVADELVHGALEHRLVGLDALTGKVRAEMSADPSGADPAALLQRTGLTLDAGRVVWGYGGNYGDCGQYHGWVMAAPEDGGRLLGHEVDAARGNSQGAVWMGGAAPEVTSTGDIWVGIGNGSTHDAASPYDGSDSVTQLTAGLSVAQRFAPASWAQQNASDQDLGSTAPALLPDGLVVQVGKSHTAYLLRRTALGTVGGAVATAPVCPGADADGGTAVTGSVVYVPCRSGLEALRVSSSPPSVTVLWSAAAGASGPPIVAGGLVWSIGGTALYGIDPTTGSTAVRLPIGSDANHFPVPADADGLLLVPGGTSGDEILAFRGSAGLPPPPAIPAG